MNSSDTTIAGQPKPLRLLFITRKFPPAKGGMERLSAGLAQEFSKHADTTIIAWGGSQVFLPFFLPYALIKSLIAIPQKRITHVHLGDALLSPLGLLLKKLFPVKVSVTACGLDITFKPKFYQALVPPSAARLDRVICISRATLAECLKRGIPEEKCTVITPGINTLDFIRNSKRDEMEQIVVSDLRGKKVLVTVGRLVKRKGVQWFVENVVTKLPKNIFYVIVGTGNEEANIRNAIAKHHLDDRVRMIGDISDEDLKIIYNTADLFVMPNRVIKGNMEGFGIVALEASAAGLPIVATDIEGIRDVVKENVNGTLVNHAGNDPKEWMSKINLSLQSKKIDRISIRKWITRNYDWRIIGHQYNNVLNAKEA